MKELYQHADKVNELLARYGVKFGIYKNGVFKEQLFPFYPIPRVIEKEEFDYLEKGLIQRVTALNCFLRDIYGEKKIVKDGVIPEEFIFSSSGFLAECDGVMPVKGIYSHISGIDLVQAKDKTWYVLEDNLRVPSGASYPMIKYYLGEESILHNAPTYLPFYEDDMKYVLENFDNLVLKDVAEAGGYGVLFGNKLNKQEKEDFIALLKKEPRRFIAQEVIDFIDIDIMDEGKIVPRKADLRAFVLTGEQTKVWASGLTRFSRNPDSFIVNSSQGGGFKDTWVHSR
ncbi:MAG: circularly permuted type 2 ATP-grasp protein [Lachnospiraceae bacterium]|nr:circularly permuted type 2 ATP-grasp protein [Lachnospiraceae bacterium]